MSTTDEWRRERDAYLKGFAANVRRLRDEQGLTQTDLHVSANLHRTEVGRIEGADIEPRLMTLVVLADGLGVSLDELVAGLPVPKERKPSPKS
jgi:putative transcriptional regulator